MPSITAKVSPAQIQGLHSTFIESHQGTDENQRQANVPRLQSHVNELKFTETIETVGVPVFGNLVNSMKSGTATISISEERSTSNQEQKQNSPPSKLSGEFFASKMDHTIAAVKQIPMRMGSWVTFFDPKHFNLPSSVSQLTERLKGNLTGFYGNYAIISLILLAYCLLTSPLLLVGIALYGFLAYSVISRNQEMNVFGQNLSTNQQLFGLTICAIPFFLFLGLTGVFFWLIGATTFLIALHSTFHELPQPEDLAGVAENGQSGLSGDVHSGRDHKPANGDTFQVITL